MRKFTLLMIACYLCFSAGFIGGCGMSPEQLREKAKVLKEKLDEAKEKNKSTMVVCAKKHIEKGAVISSDDIELKSMMESDIPLDVLTSKSAVELKKAKKDINYGEAISAKDLAPLVDQQ